MASDSRPFVTVVMPVRNEERSIDVSLGSVLEQDYPADRFEVIVADGMSTDGTRERVDALAAGARNGGRPVPVRVIDNPGQIVPTGLNRAIREARGDVVVRVDGHCQIAPTYVSRCVELLAETGADNVGGLQRAVETGALPTAIARATSSRFGVGNAEFHYATQAQWADTVYLGAYPRDVFERVGGFDEELVRNQDDEFNLRLKQHGGRIWLDPSIESLYEPRSTLRSLWRQYFQYGLFKVRVMQKRGTVPSVRHLVPAGFVLAVSGSVVGSIVGRSPMPLIVLTPYALANLSASLIVGRGDPGVTARLPAVFATLHASYGTGFIAGVWRWRARFRSRSTDSSS